MRAALGFFRKFLLLVDTFLLFLHWTGVRLLSSKNVTADLPSRGNAGDLVGDLVAKFAISATFGVGIFFMSDCGVLLLYFGRWSRPLRVTVCVFHTHTHMRV